MGFAGLQVEVREHANDNPRAENSQNKRRFQPIGWKGPIHERDHVR
jgi:hypothetical protein